MKDFINLEEFISLIKNYSVIQLKYLLLVEELFMDELKQNLKHYPARIDKKVFINLSLIYFVLRNLINYYMYFDIEAVKSLLFFYSIVLMCCLETVVIVFLYVIFNCMFEPIFFASVVDLSVVPNKLNSLINL